ncbi:craniofacial development protein 2-like [Spodoptera litura]|uniref:Craniofacial development protein 2-like n=1 Tax=Spodoptera litura TaxID=69820 RepID=A0A9J7J0L7_SPOLT|nr:craniofacial development protein 2-like [Spodoptera litura]
MSLSSLSQCLRGRLVPGNKEDKDKISPNKKYRKDKSCYQNIANLNVRTLMSDSRRIELEYAISKLNWDIIGLCETRRKSEEINEFPDYILYHTKSIKGLHGVGFLVKKHLKKNIIYFKSYSDRVATLDISLPKGKVLSIVQVYAPTEKCNDEELNTFYKTLDLAVEVAHNRNLIIMGDFNAQIGKALQGEDSAFGKYSNGKRSKHGQRLVEFALENNLKFTNSMFKIRKNRKWTWLSPNGQHRTEIDYILTSSNVKRPLQTMFNNVLEKRRGGLESPNQ